MKNTLILASFLALAPFAKGQLLLEALDAPDAIPANWPNNIKFNNDEHLIVSVFDRDFLPYQDPTGPAVWNTAPVPADNRNETQAIDWQGTISTDGFSVKIPITATGSGSLPAYNTTFVVPTNRTEDGISRVVQLTWEPQTYNTGTKYITATVKSLGGILNIKKLDINTGLGNDFRGVSLGQFNIPNIGAPSGIYDIRVMAVVPDRNFDVPTSNGVLEHQFAYVPVKGPDGKYWLNNNLGADYANVNSTDWNPQQGPKNSNDHKSFGSVFQLGRKADGHELVSWRDRSFTPKYPHQITLPTGSTLEDAKTNAYIPYWYNHYSKYSSGSVLFFWGKNGVNDPCPIGFHTPTKQEFDNLDRGMRELNGSSDRNTAVIWKNELVKIPYTGIIIRSKNNEIVQLYDRSSPSPITIYSSSTASRHTTSVDLPYGIDWSSKGIGFTNWGREAYMGDSLVWHQGLHWYVPSMGRYTETKVETEPNMCLGWTRLEGDGGLVCTSWKCTQRIEGGDYVPADSCKITKKYTNIVESPLRCIKD